MNALNRELGRALGEAMVEFSRDDQLLVAILSGEGGRAFSTGGDLKEMSTRQQEGRGIIETTDGGASGAYPPVAKPGTMLGMDQLNECPKPVIAAIDGYCLAGGLEIALYCDIRLATRRSTFAMPEPRRSLLSGPALIHLSRMIPLGEALRIQLTGAAIGAQRAYEIGLVQDLAEDRDQLFAMADAVADEILECAPLAVQYIKRVIKDGRNLPVEYAWKFSEMCSDAISKTEDALEGPRAFAQKRKRDWKLR